MFGSHLPPRVRKTRGRFGSLNNMPPHKSNRSARRRVIDDNMQQQKCSHLPVVETAEGGLYLLRADVLRPVSGTVNPAVDRLQSASRVSLAELIPDKQQS